MLLDPYFDCLDKCYVHVIPTLLSSLSLVPFKNNTTRRECSSKQVYKVEDACEPCIHADVTPGDNVIVEACVRAIIKSCSIGKKDKCSNHGFRHEKEGYIMVQFDLHLALFEQYFANFLHSLLFG